MAETTTTPKPTKPKPDHRAIAKAQDAIDAALANLTDADAMRALDAAKAARK